MNKTIRLFVPDFSVEHMKNNDQFIAYKDKYWGNEIEVDVPEADCHWSDTFGFYNVWTYEWKIVTQCNSYFNGKESKKMKQKFAVIYEKNGRIVSTYFDCRNNREEVADHVRGITGVDMNHPTECYKLSVMSLGQNGYIYQ